MQPSSYSFFVDSRKIPSRVSIPLSSGKRRSSGILTAVDDAVLREDSFLVILLTQTRSDEGTPLPPGRTMLQSQSQSGPDQEEAALAGPCFKAEAKAVQTRSVLHSSIFVARLVLCRPVVLPRSPIPFSVLRRSPKVSSSPVSSECIDPFPFVRLEGGEEEELNILTSTERQKIFSCQLRR